jgi:hypothetical protein
MVTKSISSLIDRIVSKIADKSDPKISAPEEYEFDDLSYEDALLDVEIRSFMRTEFGKKMPPHGVFPRVMQAIKLYREDQAKNGSLGVASRLTRIAGSLGQAIVATYKVGTRLDASRMVSGGLITALLLLAVWPGMARSLTNGGQLEQYLDVLSGGVGSASTVETTGRGTTESPTSISSLSAASTPVPAASTESAAQQSVYMSPGRIYDDPRLMLAQRTGENPTDLESKKHSNKPALDVGTADDGSSQLQAEPNHNRPMTGQD